MLDFVLFLGLFPKVNWTVVHFNQVILDHSLKNSTKPTTCMLIENNNLTQKYAILECNTNFQDSRVDSYV